MFGFLKEKLKKAVSIFTKKVDEEADVVKEEAEEKAVLEKPAMEAKKEIIRKDIIKKEAIKKETKKKVKEEREARAKKAKEAKKEPEKKEAEPEKPAAEKKEAAKEAAVTAAEEILPAKKEIEKETREEEIEKEEYGLEKEEEIEEEIREEEPKTEERGFFAKLKDRLIGKEKKKEEEKKDKKEEKRLEEEKKKEEKETKPPIIPFIKPEISEKPAEERGFFAKLKETITKKTLSEEKFDELFYELEIALLENNVAVEVIEKIKNDLRKNLVNQKLDRGRLEEIIENTLKGSIESLFDVPKINLLGLIKNKKEKPFVMAFVGVNGSGKTTTIAKLAKYFQKNNLRCVIAASDTFRAAAIQQLEEHADRLGVKLIKHDYGADPAAVAFDAIKFANSKGMDVVMIDTAGRLHSNTNLMDEMKKIVRVAKPDLKIFIGESITGNDCIEQAKQFNNAIGIDGIILAKADVDEKGGAAVSVSYITGKPIMFLGVGQQYEDLKEFDKEIILANIGI